MPELHYRGESVDVSVDGTEWKYRGRMHTSYAQAIAAVDHWINVVYPKFYKQAVGIAEGKRWAQEFYSDWTMSTEEFEREVGYAVEELWKASRDRQDKAQALSCGTEGCKVCPCKGKSKEVIAGLNISEERERRDLAVELRECQSEKGRVGDK
jgi:hypothetical protein